MAIESAQAIFDAMPGRFQPDQAAGLNAMIQFDLSGDGGGQWNVAIADQKCTVSQGVAPNPTVTLSAAAADYIAVVAGALNPMAAFMQGKVKVRGDMTLALKLQKLFGAG